MKSADHWLSVNEKELQSIVLNVKFAHESLGINQKIAFKCEQLAKKMQEEVW